MTSSVLPLPREHAHEHALALSPQAGLSMGAMLVERGRLAAAGAERIHAHLHITPLDHERVRHAQQYPTGHFHHRHQVNVIGGLHKNGGERPCCGHAFFVGGQGYAHAQLFATRRGNETQRQGDHVGIFTLAKIGSTASGFGTVINIGYVIIGAFGWCFGATAAWRCAGRRIFVVIRHLLSARRVRRPFA